MANTQSNTLLIVLVAGAAALAGFLLLKGGGLISGLGQTADALGSVAETASDTIGGTRDAVSKSVHDTGRLVTRAGSTAERTIRDVRNEARDFKSKLPLAAAGVTAPIAQKVLKSKNVRKARKTAAKLVKRAPKKVKKVLSSVKKKTTSRVNPLGGSGLRFGVKIAKRVKAKKTAKRVLRAPKKAVTKVVSSVRKLF